MNNPSEPEVLTGGNSNQVVREGNTVVRQTGKWSPFVHSLLEYLTANGFKESPVLLGSSEHEERLSYFDGEVGNYPLKPYMQSDAILIEAAKLLRRFHDLTQAFVVPSDAVFQLPINANTGHEVICHNDFAPYNCVFDGQHLIGIIDFDTASPGTPIWDIAYAVYRFVPLTNEQHTQEGGWLHVPDKPRRLKLFCDAYGLENREMLVQTVIKRLEALVEHMRATGSNPEHIPIYMEDLRYLRENQSIFSEALKASF